MRILVTDSDNRSALAATRSLGRRKHVIITAGEHRKSLAAVSKYSTQFVTYPSPTKQPEAFMAAILAAVTEHRIDLLLPMTDITTLLLTEQRALLPDSCRLPFADASAVREAADKGRMVQLAKDLGIPTPATQVLSSREAADALSAQIEYPVVIKPTRSRIRTAGGWISTRVTYAKSREALLAALDKIDPAAYPVLLQERICGPGVGFFACYDHGRPVAYFAHRRLREKPPSGGVSVLRESAPLNPAAVQYGSKLLEHLKWHGVAMVEFKQDSRDDSLRLMEINGRFWGSLQLAIDSGVDFPAILADVAAGKQLTPVFDYKIGVRSRWLLGDLDVLLLVMLRSRKALNLPVGYPGRWRLLWDFLRPKQKDVHSEVFRVDDPRPSFLELRTWLFGS